MRLSYNLTLSDYLVAQHLHYWRKFSLRLILILNYLVFPLLGLVGLALYIISKVSHPQEAWGAGFLPAIAILLALPVLFQFNLRRSYKKSRVTDADCIFELTDDNIQTDLPGYARSTIEWQAVRQYLENKKTILVYIAPTRFFVVPKRVLADGQREELLGLLERHIEPKKI